MFAGFVHVLETHLLAYVSDGPCSTVCIARSRWLCRAATGRHVREEGAILYSRCSLQVTLPCCYGPACPWRRRYSVQSLFVTGDFAVLLRAGMSVKKALFCTVVVRYRWLCRVATGRHVGKEGAILYSRCSLQVTLPCCYGPACR